MNTLGKIYLLLAGAIIIAHTFYPHQHNYGKLESEIITEYNSSKNLADLLEQAFHLDQGEGHLEIFKTSNYLQLNNPAKFCGFKNFIFHSNLILEDHKPFLPYQSDLRTQNFLSQLRFRGPPATN